MVDLVIPLFIYTQRSRDKFRAVHSAIATQVVNHKLRKFQINIYMRFHYQFYFQFEIIFQCNSFCIVLSYSLER